jgi:rRNA maturation endonuclease Nob1
MHSPGSIRKIRKSSFSFVDAFFGKKQCLACGASTSKAYRQVCKYCGGDRWIAEKTWAKTCAACQKGTRNKKREYCKMCGCHRWYASNSAESPGSVVGASAGAAAGLIGNSANSETASIQ